MKILLGFAFCAAALSAAESNSVLIRNVTVHPVTGPNLENGSVLVVDGKIEEVGRKVAPRSGVRVIDGKGMHLYPGMINAATNVGLAEIEAVHDTVDLNEIGEFNPQLRAEIAFNPSSEHVPVVRAAGITSLIALPSDGSRGGRGGAGSVITGQGALMHLDGWTWEEMAVRPSAVMEMLFPEIRAPRNPFFAAISTAAPARTFQDEERQYHAQLNHISDFLEDVRRYKKAKDAKMPGFERDLKLEAMLGVIDGTQPLFIRAERERMIKDAIAFADKEKVKIIIAEPQELGAMGPELKKHNIPVVLGKVFSLPEHEDDAYDAPYTLPGEFYRAGVKFCFGTFDVEFARNVPFEAAQAAAFGLPKEEALKAVTINSAEILGAGAQIGSIEKGKLADLILTDGDPLEARTNIKQMFISGKEVSLESRHTREYEKWLKRP
jgi:imidazolonepropionase-like amidohydrolase